VPEPSSQDQCSFLACRIRGLVWLFIVGLVLSGATAIPLETELRFFTQWTGDTREAAQWIFKIRDALVETNTRYPFMAYGTDWLAFGHFVIAVAFVGPLCDPIKNVWVIEFGMIACVLIIPFALAMGAVRGIPLGWRLIDCSFGVFGMIPLWFCRKYIREMEQQCTRLFRTF
jgi:hypothetical protein